MPVTLQPLFEPAQIPAVNTSFFAAKAPTQIDKMTIVNSDVAGSHWATIFLVPSGGAAGASNEILIGNLPGKLLQPGEAYDVVTAMGHILNPGDAIWAIADVANKVNFFASGRVVS